MSEKQGSKSSWMDRFKESSLNKLLSLLFLVFLVASVVYVFYIVFVPTPTEWGIVTREIQRNATGSYVPVQNASSFPNDFTCGNLTNAFFRHLAFFPQYVNPSFFITTINFAFLTMFIWHIGDDIKGRKVKMSNYVEWAMGSLVSGILFFSSSINIYNLSIAFTTIAIIVVFALVLYFLYKFKRKLEKDEERVICKKCGSLNLPSDKFCSNCGSPLPS